MKFGLLDKYGTTMINLFFFNSDSVEINVKATASIFYISLVKKCRSLIYPYTGVGTFILNDFKYFIEEVVNLEHDKD